MHDREPDPRREAVKIILTARHGQAVPATEEEIDAVLAALDEDPSYDGWRHHREIPRFGADPADTSY